jgi:hypothetical protein
MRNRTKPAATLEERLADHARQSRESAEKLPVGEYRDAMIRKVREIEAAVYFHRRLGISKPNRQ